MYRPSSRSLAATYSTPPCSKTWTPHRAAAGVARVELGQLAVGVRVVGEQRM
jgi:hypothetical protein